MIRREYIRPLMAFRRLAVLAGIDPRTIDAETTAGELLLVAGLAAERSARQA